MKTISKYILFGLTMFTLSYLSTVSAGNYKAQTDFDGISYSTENPVSHQQTKAQVELFRKALDEFGADSPEQVISIWANAEKTRNGVLHYAVASRQLKDKMIKEWGEPKDTYWIYGGSSPGLDKYEVAYNNKISETEYEVKIKFFWSTSAGPSEPSATTLSITKIKDIWCVKEVK